MHMAFVFEYRIKVRNYGQIRRHVEMKFVKGGVQINADDIEMESQKFMAAENYAAYNTALGAAPDADPIETARAAVAAHKPGKVETAIRDNSIVQFSHIDSDSPYYD
ncbi:MAG: hypothetical protein RLZZ40_266 [Actinomycetota bacterium]